MSERERVDQRIASMSGRERVTKEREKEYRAKGTFLQLRAKDIYIHCVLNNKLISSYTNIQFFK